MFPSVSYVRRALHSSHLLSIGGSHVKSWFLSHKTENWSAHLFAIQYNEMSMSQLYLKASQLMNKKDETHPALIILVE